MLQRVGQALLDDPVRRQIDRAWERDGVALDLEPHRQPGSTDALDQGVEALEAGLGRQIRVLTVVHRAEEPAHLRERRPARLLDVLERVAVRRQLSGEVVPDGADLEHHHADGVGDDVVELARDPRALLGHGEAGGRLALPFCLARPLLRLLGLSGPLAQREAREPPDSEQHRDEDELSRSVPWIVVDDGRRAADHDRQPDARLRLVAEVAEQEGRDHAGHRRDDAEHDEPAVDDRARRCDHPDGRGRGEGIAAAQEQRQHDQRERRDREPPSRRRRVDAVPERALERDHERREHDQRVESVAADDWAEAAHGVNVLQGLGRRLLLR
jgi:hypothetical protein